MDNQTLYRRMCRIRFFEELVLEKFPSGVFVGTTHTYLGQEANAVGVIAHLEAEDIVFSNHRGHGHFLAYGGEARALFAELMGKQSGVCGGRGGSQHLHWRNFYSNGVQGGIVPIASGMALAEKIKHSGAIAVAFLGDGTLGEGVIYEAFNMASKWQVPVLYVLENNRIAQTTPIELTLAGSIADRFRAFGIPCAELDTSDVVEIYQAAGRWIAQVRETQSPRALILNTYRFGPHSKGDDTRPAEEIARIREAFDPLKIHAPRLSPQERARIEEEEREGIRLAFEAALREEYPSALTPSPSPEGRGGIGNTHGSSPKEGGGVGNAHGSSPAMQGEATSPPSLSPAGRKGEAFAPGPSPEGTGEVGNAHSSSPTMQGEATSTPNFSPAEDEGEALTPSPSPEGRGGIGNTHGSSPKEGGGVGNAHSSSPALQGEATSTPSLSPEGRKGEAFAPGPSPEGRGGVDSPLPLGEGLGVRETHLTVLQSLNRALHRALAQDERVYLLGQDLLDPYGGAFKVTQGCSTQFPQRVLPTPISEAGLVGMAAGMALRGLLPVAEIMFGDFLTLIADQVINHIAKFHWMYNAAVKVPLVIRTPMGGGRGYGPTHSQSLEKLYLGVPGIHVVAATHLGEPHHLLLEALFQDEHPVIFIEHKSLYPLQVFEEMDQDFERTVAWTSLGYPVYTLRLKSAPPPSLTLVAYSYMAELARQAMLQLAYQDEIFCELVVPTQLNPYAGEKFLDSAQRTGRVLVIEEGTLTLGWGAEVLARLAENTFPHPIQVCRLAAAEHPIPASPPLEKATLPSVEAIVQRAKSLF